MMVMELGGIDDDQCQAVIATRERQNLPLFLADRWTVTPGRNENMIFMYKIVLLQK